MKRVTGLGGIFFKTNDLPRMREWYQTHLGLDIAPAGYACFDWRDAEEPDKKGSTAWSLFKDDTKYFAPSTEPYMINYRVANLAALLETLRAEGVWVDDKFVEDEYGKFAWIMDPEGRRIELWEPPENQ